VPIIIKPAPDSNRKSLYTFFIEPRSHLIQRSFLHKPLDFSQIIIKTIRIYVSNIVLCMTLEISLKVNPRHLARDAQHIQARHIH